MNANFTAEDLVIFRNALILVLNKPSGIAVHKGRKGGVTLEDFFNELTYGLPFIPKLAHRLDAATSGCLILGRNKHALTHLGHLFTHQRIDKTYWALVEGGPSDNEDLIDAPLAKQSTAKHNWWMKVDPTGQPSKTHYRVLQRFEDKTLLELKPLTGRTHQLRVHCAHMGFPIVGDQIYGTLTSYQPLCLHAYSVTIPLFPKKEPLFITAPLPSHMAHLKKE